VDTNTADNICIFHNRAIAKKLILTKRLLNTFNKQEYIVISTVRLTHENTVVSNCFSFLILRTYVDLKAAHWKFECESDTATS
jgi:hypothetical protein